MDTTALRKEVRHLIDKADDRLLHTTAQRQFFKVLEFFFDRHSYDRAEQLSVGESI